MVYLGVFPTARFAMCQDTGGAIQGPGRVDISVDDLEIGPCESVPTLRIEATVVRPASRGVTAPPGAS